MDDHRTLKVIFVVGLRDIAQLILDLLHFPLLDPCSQLPILVYIAYLLFRDLHFFKLFVISIVDLEVLPLLTLLAVFLFISLLFEESLVKAPGLFLDLGMLAS